MRPCSGFLRGGILRRSGGFFRLLGLRHFAKGLCSGEKGNDLCLHVAEILEPDAWIEYNERFARTAVFVDANDGAVRLFLGVAFD